MRQRILGPSGGRGRKRRVFLLSAVLAVMSLGAYMITSAFAVHDYGVFQLDGNAEQSDTSPDSLGGDDWDNICTPLGGGCIGGASSHLTAKSFDQDGAQNATVYTGGGSKDIYDIDNWQWKTDSGGLPDKDNLQQAFTARYAYSTTLTAAVNTTQTTISVANGSFFPPSGTSPYDIAVGSEIMRVLSHSGNDLTVVRGVNGSTATTHSSGDVVLVSLIYFGATRFDASGDAQIGFWFLQGNVGTIPGKKNTFGPDKHKVGDLLILSDFTQGGTQPTIRAYKWVGSGGNTNGTLQSITDPNAPAASCISGSSATVGAGDSFCAVVNTQTETSPWSFTNKDGLNDFSEGEFYEGGINLSAFPGLAQECFGSFLSETRSAQSADAVLKDFVLGPFASCESSLVSTQKWVPNDTATVSAPVAVNGTLSIQMYTGDNCGATSGSAVNGQLYQKTLTNASSAADRTLTTSNTTEITAASASTTVSWLVTFTSSDPSVKSSSHCEKSTGLTITD